MSRLVLVRSLVLVLLSLVVLGGCGGSGGEDSEHDLVPAPETNVTDTNTTPDTNGTQPDDSNGTTGGGSDDGNTTGGGNDTNTTAPTMRLSALKLTAAATTLNKDHNTTVTLTATYSDNTTKPLTSGITWIITPQEAVTLHGTTLTARKDVNVTVQAKVGTILSNKVNLNIYWEVNGHRLPPEPDPVVNNSTLLGVDVNHNGIRDDAERWIILHYAKDPKYPKTKTAIALQYAWASQKILENPTMESSKYEDDALACEFYWFDTKTKGLSGFKSVQYSIKHKVFGAPKIKDVIYNTKERIQRKFSYNRALSGHILKGRVDELSACHTNIDELGE